jgi:hypothetical protein
MLTRHAIQVLRQAGHELRDVARLVGVEVRTVCGSTVNRTSSTSTLSGAASGLADDDA